MTSYATQAQVDWMKETMLTYQLFDNHYDRLWKLLMVHEMDVRTPGDGTRMTAETADKTVAWLQRQTGKMSVPQDQHRVSEQPPAGSLADTEENQGVYLKNGEVYVVKFNKTKTRLYARRLVEAPGHQRRTTEAGTRSSFDLEYAPGVFKTLTAADRMTLEDAREVMTRYGRCLYCKHPLRAAESVERMVGPVCAKRFAA